MSTQRIACLGVGFGLVLACGEPAEEMMQAETETEADDAADGGDTEDAGSACVERFAEAQCLGGGAPRFQVGDVQVPADATEPTLVAEFDGGRLVEGMPGDVEVIYVDDSCLVSCVWMLPQTRFCEGVNEDGEKTCMYGTNQEFSVEDCMEFVEVCKG